MLPGTVVGLNEIEPLSRWLSEKNIVDLGDDKTAACCVEACEMMRKRLGWKFFDFSAFIKF